MPDNVLVATTGRPTGSAASRRLRAQERIPGVIYGHGQPPLSVSVERRDLRLAVSGPAGLNTVLSMSVDGQSFAALIKAVQRHPVRRTVSHVDFLRVDLNESITVNVPLRLHGEAKAVIAAGGLVDPAVDTIEVVTTPNNMPAEITVDISDMEPGGVIHLSELTIPEGSEATGDPDMVVVTALAATVLEEEAPAEEEAEGEGEAEGGEAEGAAEE
jgi:large subunit ribosomal protein L25